MQPQAPVAAFAAHEVLNQPPPLENYNLFDRDAPLAEALHREGAGWAEERVRALGELTGSAHMIELGHQANRFPPELRLFDRFGHRIDEVTFHPAYHELMGLWREHELHSIAWTAGRPGGHVAHAALLYLFIQAECGTMCPMSMAYASIPALRQQPELAAELEPRILSTAYDPRAVPIEEKAGMTIGMGMTEKQGGSDVRANITRAVPLGHGGPGGEYELHGHKWFYSAPMSDALLTLAYTDGGLCCFYVPRWRPDGTRNAVHIQRLKDKLGNRSNASSEIEYHGAWGRMVGEEGRGVRTIIEMVQLTRFDVAMAAAGQMRQALTQALHHTAHREVFGKLLSRQPLMINVLADLAIEVEAATAMMMRVARAQDEGQRDSAARSFARLAIAPAKYWVSKRSPSHIYEAMECLGGGGYVEESILPRLYREAPINSIWEGSGNVICLDVLRTMEREPGAMELFLAEVERASGADARLDAALVDLKDMLARTEEFELRARRLVESMALVFQGALLVQHAPPAVADAYCASRLDGEWGRAFGTLPSGCDFEAIVERAGPQVD